MQRIFLMTTVLTLIAGVALADEIEDSLKGALAAYQAGKVKDAMDAAAYAQQLMQTKRGGALAAFLPAAPDGWTRTDTADINQGLNVLGGGVGAEASYAEGDTEFKITLMANNSMVASMATILGNTVMMAQMGKIVKVGDRKFLNQDGTLSALVCTQVLVQAQGADPEKMLPLLQKIDFSGLEKFGL